MESRGRLAGEDVHPRGEDFHPGGWGVHPGGKDFHPGEDSDGAPRVGQGGDAARAERRGGAGGVAGGVPWREAGPPNHLDDKVGYVSASGVSGAESDSSRVGKSRPPRAAGSGAIRPSYTGLYPQTGGDVHRPGDATVPLSRGDVHRARGGDVQPGEESSDGASRVGQFEQSRLEVPVARQTP